MALIKDENSETEELKLLLLMIIICYIFCKQPDSSHGKYWPSIRNNNCLNLEKVKENKINKNLQHTLKK